MGGWAAGREVGERGGRTEWALARKGRRSTAQHTHAHTQTRPSRTLSHALARPRTRVAHRHAHVLATLRSAPSRAAAEARRASLTATARAPLMQRARALRCLWRFSARARAVVFLARPTRSERAARPPAVRARARTVEHAVGRIDALRDAPDFRSAPRASLQLVQAEEQVRLTVMV